MQRPIPPQAEQPREGFTLVEILIATVLVGIVMGMAMLGFTQAKKSADLSRSIALSSAEASSGLKEVVNILRRASIVYYTAQPMQAMAAAATVPPAARTAIPVQLLNLPAGNAGPSIHFDPANPAGLTPNQTAKFSSIAGTVNRNSYRFAAPGGGGFRDSTDFAGGGQTRLFGNHAAPSANNFFSAPLVYCAEAIMGQNISGTGRDTTALVPQGWIFYVIYLAPMDMAPAGVLPASVDADPLFPTPGAGSVMSVQDRGGVPGIGAGSWPRSIVPYELRLLTIRGGGPKGEIPATVGNARQVDNNGAILPVPWDIAPGACVYDPIATTNGTNAGGIITGGYTPYANVFPYFNPANIATHEAFRVAGVGAHSNYGSPANDPPTTSVLATASAVNSSDRVLARYIDPDNPTGTFIKFENPYYNLPANQPGVPANLTGNNRLLNTYEGGFENYDPGTNFPTRAVVSITTRFRTSRQVPFQFSTKSEEVSLEAFHSYCDSSKLRWNRN